LKQSHPDILRDLGLALKAGREVHKVDPLHCSVGLIDSLHRARLHFAEMKFLTYRLPRVTRLSAVGALSAHFLNCAELLIDEKTVDTPLIDGHQWSVDDLCCSLRAGAQHEFLGAAAHLVRVVHPLAVTVGGRALPATRSPARCRVHRGGAPHKKSSSPLFFCVASSAIVA
jgi:hypothetical protein